MATNRAEKEQLDEVMKECAPEGNSKLGALVQSMIEANDAIKNFVESGSIIVADEQVEELMNMHATMQKVIQEYANFGKRIADASAKLDARIAASMAKAKAFNDENAEIAAKVKTQVENVKMPGK